MTSTFVDAFHAATAKLSATKSATRRTREAGRRRRSSQEIGHARVQSGRVAAAARTRCVRVLDGLGNNFEDDRILLLST